MIIDRSIDLKELKIKRDWAVHQYWYMADLALGYKIKNHLFNEGEAPKSFAVLLSTEGFPEDKNTGDLLRYIEGTRKRIAIAKEKSFCYSTFASNFSLEEKNFCACVILRLMHERLDDLEEIVIRIGELEQKEQRENQK